MLPNSNSDPAADPAAQPTPQAAPASDPSSETVTITRGELERYKSFEGRVPNLQRENEALKKQVQPQQGQDNTRSLLERAHALGQQNKSLDEALSLIQGEQTEQEFRANVGKLVRFFESGGALPAGPGTAQGVDMARVLNDYKLDPRDPYVAAQMKDKTFATETEAELFAARLFRDKQLAPNPNQAQSPTSPGQLPPSGGTDYEALAEEYDRLSTNPSENFKRMSEIQEALRQLK